VVCTEAAKATVPARLSNEAVTTASVECEEEVTDRSLTILAACALSPR
jgi:hypothetical protein